MAHISDIANEQQRPSYIKSLGQDKFQGHDYYQVDELLSEEHLLIRDTVRTWVKQNVSPIIEEYAQRAEFPHQLVKGLAEIGAFDTSNHTARI